MNNDNNKKPRSLFYYYGLALLIILVINTVIMPTFVNPKVKDVSYNSFIKMVDEGKVRVYAGCAARAEPDCDVLHQLDYADSDFLCLRPAVHVFYGQAHGRQRYELWQEQR